MPRQETKHQQQLKEPSQNKLKIFQVTVKDKRVFYHVNFNVPQDELAPNTIMDTARIEAALPTIKNAFKDGAKPVIVARTLATLPV